MQEQRCWQFRHAKEKPYALPLIKGKSSSLNGKNHHMLMLLRSMVSYHGKYFLCQI
jgi:hypothetical protein